MNIRAVIERELRVTARRPLNRWLRFGGAAALFALLLVLGQQQAWGGRQPGARLFSALNLALFGGIWLFGPLLSADCLSREKREGTLGLLFLTPLSSLDIALAKGLTHFLSALTLLVAAAPVLMVPVLFGGVAGLDVARAVLLNLGALCLALAAGLLASAFAREWVRAMVLSLLLSGGSAFVFLSAYAMGRVWRYFQLAPGRAAAGFLRSYWGGFMHRWYEWVTSGGFFSGGVGGTWGVGTTDWWLLGLAGVLLVFAVGLAGLATLVASRQIQRAWNADPRSPRPQRRSEVFDFYQAFSGPAVFRRRMRRRLERNPVAWLQQRSGNARLAKWGWCGLILIGPSVALAFGGLVGALVWLHRIEMLVVLGMVFTAASSFRNDRESGVMEVLLVTPLTERQILWGRLWGIWQQFFPAVLTLGFGALLLIPRTEWVGNLPRSDLALLLSLHVVGLYLGLPIIGVYFGLWRIHLLVAVALSLVVGFGPPSFLGRLAGQGWWWASVPAGAIASMSEAYSLAFAFGWRVTCAAVVWWLWEWRWRHRRSVLA